MIHDSSPFTQRLSALDLEALGQTALEHLTLGTVLTRLVTIPEGFRLRQMAPRIAELTGVVLDSVVAIIETPEVAQRLGVPGPGAGASHGWGELSGLALVPEPSTRGSRRR